MSAASLWKMPTHIIHSRILIVEGQDEAFFFYNFFKYLEIDENAFHIVDIGGNPKFNANVRLLTKTTNFTENARTIGIIRDAEKFKAQSAFDSTNSTLSSCFLPQPEAMKEFTNATISKISVGVFIMPDCYSAGMFEDLCLQSLPSKFHKCYDELTHCIQTDSIEKLSKSKIQVHLAMSNPLKYSIGHSAQSKIWDFSHPCFNDIKSFLLNFAQQPI